MFILYLICFQIFSTMQNTCICATWQQVPKSYSITLLIHCILLILSVLQHSLINVNSIFWCFCKFYGRKFSFFKPLKRLQTRSKDQKPGICFPTLLFENANKTLFSNPNAALVNYHFIFSERSTRFPCDFFQPTLFRPEILKNSTFQTG